VAPELCQRGTASASYKRQLDQYQLADELGFDMVSMSEHHYAPGLMTPNPILMATAASQRTKRVRLALLGPLMPLTNPVRVAEEVAMLDSISEGRAVVLPLRGTPNEHAIYSADGKPSPFTREITQEATLLMIKAWQEPKPFKWEGQHFQFNRVAVWPRTAQEPHPPVFYSGNSDESLAFAAEHRLSLAIGFAPAKIVAKRVATYRELAAQHGWTPTHDNVLYRARALVSPDDERAQEIVKRQAERFAKMMSRTRGVNYGPSATAEAPRPTPGEGGGAPNVGAFQFYGTPKTIVEQVRNFHDAGVGVLDIAFAGDAYGAGGTVKSLHAIADVLPEIQAL
jgi:alkanesulfonate monooxygenase SsuD/methylene tetrahydromethanopterin reductase-like flavin-dependent oxidoreductase (luciferase family)